MLNVYARRASLAFACLLLSPAAAWAQDEAARNYIYATYFQCDTAREPAADLIVEQRMAPVYDAAVEEGLIAGWGWLSHHTGGKWRRILYRVVSDIDALIDGPAEIQKRLAAADDGTGAEFGSICSIHDDYIWRTMHGPTADITAVDRGAAGISTYYDCDQSKDDRADAFVEEIVGPIYNRLMSEGKLKSWGWSEHWIGGEWRRLATISGADHKTLLKARDAAIEELLGKHERRTREFSSICPTHVDYLWDIEHEAPRNQ